MNAPYDGDGGQSPGSDPTGPAPSPATPHGSPPPAPGPEAPSRDAFAHLYSDQRQPYAPQRTQSPAPPSHPGAAAGPLTDPGPPAGEQPTPPQAEPAPTDRQQPQAKRPAGRGGSLMKSSAVMAAGTLVSRLTGFLRQLVITAAIGAALLGDSYTVAMNLPTMIYVLTIGGGLNSVFVPQLIRAMKKDDDGGEAYANRLLTLVMVILGALVAVSALAAPWLIRAMSVPVSENPAANDVAVTFARYCLPTIFFMGVHVVMGQILNARGRFGAMMWTPVLNNIVVIFTFSMFIWIYGTADRSDVGVTTIAPEGLRLLGIGTLLGLTLQALAMLPYLRAAGFTFRPRFDWRGHGLGKAARLAKWTVLFVLANQAGLVVATQLATRAGAEADKLGFPGTGIMGYNNAFLIWQMPQAIITVSVMAALLPRISRSAADGDTAAVRDDISHGLRSSAVAIVPISFAFVALGIPMCTMMFSASGPVAAHSMGYILMAFGLGLIPYSMQYVVLRGFYAYEDTRTPFYNTVIVAMAWGVLSAVSYFVLPARWVVAGIAVSYGLAYAIGVGIAWSRLRRRVGGDLDGAHVVRTYARLVGASIPAALAGGLASLGITRFTGEGTFGSLGALVGGGTVLLCVFYLAAKKMRIEEMTAMVGMVRARLGR
ncbi:murein biosynthesis integral membrane protein MurJ [Streptomyces sp. TP-A0874]|uniref:murein biosynthesis integral membrane protein MurJ n=1 Tax=Streptomyces sp. TP-A0874 TaxID=549819 RepID=UPI0008533D88|nr:murein biosynthesis integral membrane protein MurJ [Streptomyces sp. TP-A0874]